MAHQPLFSTYRTGENRVTSSILAVFERIDLDLVARLLASASGESSLDMVTYTNQVAKGGAPSVPDAAITANFRYLFEVKTVRNAITNGVQIGGHLTLLNGDHADERLFVITPDAALPKAIVAIDDPRIVWCSFTALNNAVDDLIADPTELIGERTAFLLREMQALFRAEGLLHQTDVVVVAAREAFPEYLKINAYVCQAGRAFTTGLTHIGFYAAGAIQPPVPRILHREDNVVFSHAEADARDARDHAFDRPVAAVIRTCLAASTRIVSQPYQVFILSGPDDAQTVRLANSIVNTTTTSGGRKWAWTLGQRYICLESLLKNPANTTELDAIEAASSAFA